jgi:hypothetical protein
MSIDLERRLLQIAVAVAGLVPVGAGLGGALLGLAFVAPATHDVSLDSHFRYLSGLLLAIGLVFWAAVPVIEQRTLQFRLLTAIVFVGGLARLVGIARAGWPSSPMLFGLTMELIVTPLLCAWQGRVARRFA